MLLRQSKKVEQASGNQASGNQASGNQASGNQASGNQASGNQASGKFGWHCVTPGRYLLGFCDSDGLIQHPAAYVYRLKSGNWIYVAGNPIGKEPSRLEAMKEAVKAIQREIRFGIADLRNPSVLHIKQEMPE